MGQGVVMRRAGLISAFAVAVALGLGCDDVLARTQTPHAVQSMTIGTDPEQLQSAIRAWIVATVSSTQFMVGVGVGVMAAEVLRFTWRAVFRVLGGAAQAANFVVQHRLIVVITAAAATYAVARFVI